ncbi:MAG: CDP-archaeol synthase [Zetaproteobacteria bacterium]|nr:MAG: CDP-archaeol synthase [Zetaproteobacteria bacterium]
MATWLVDVQLLVVITLANGSPILARKLLPAWWNTPIDGDKTWRDGYPILGASKTWRGMACGILGGMVGSLFFGWPWQLGMAIGLAAMTGDLVSSFVKRRLGIPTEGRATGLDQIPESFIPALIAQSWLGGTLLDAALISLAFMTLEILISPWLCKVGWRKHPY